MKWSVNETQKATWVARQIKAGRWTYRRGMIWLRGATSCHRFSLEAIRSKLKRLVAAEEK